MYRNQYDTDVTVWSPQGRIHQIEYADKAVTEGSATIGIRSRTHAVLVALKRSSHELSGHQKKIYALDDHVGISISGLLSDARLLARFMQSECLSWRLLHQEMIPITRLISNLQTKMQVNTQRYGRRPFGVGLLVAGFDMIETCRSQTLCGIMASLRLCNQAPSNRFPGCVLRMEQGPHIVQTCPSAHTFECFAMSIGARSQSAKTYLEKHLDEFENCDINTLCRHALLALRSTLPNELSLTAKNTSVAIVGGGKPFKIYEERDVLPYLEAISETGSSVTQEPSEMDEISASATEKEDEASEEHHDP